MSLKLELKSLVANAKTKEAVAKLLLLSNQETDDAITNSIVLLSSRFNRLEKDNLLGILSRSDANLESAQINHALISLIDELPNDVVSAPAPNQTIAAANNIIVTGDNNIIVQGIGGSTININQK